MIGQVISHYKILEKLGEGGMGIVYKARDTKLDRDVALKFLPHHLTANEAEQARFLQEARAASALNHPNVCGIHAIGEHGGQNFIDMEYVDGMTLRKKLASGPLGLDAAITYAIQIGDALDDAHAKHIVHRDIKCENIMINSKNIVKVMDFGLAKLKGSLKLTRTSSTVGTLAYMAPEQIQGAEVDGRSDIFSFGVVLFEMLTGHLPFRGEHEAAIMYSILNEEPEPLTKYLPEASPEMLHIFGRALEKDPEDRYQSVHDMVIDLRRLKKESTRVSRSSLASMPVPERAHPTEPVAAMEPSEKPTSKKKWIIGAGVSLLILIIAVAGYLLIPKNSEPTERLQIAVTDFVNQTGEKELDGLSGMLITAMEQSRRLSVLTRSRMFDILKSMGRGDADKIDETLGKAICNQANIGALVTASVRKFGKLYTIDLKVLDPRKNEYIFTAKEEGEGQENIPSMLDKLSEKTRIGLKEQSNDVKTANVATVTTSNLEAYQHYFQGEQLINRLNFIEAQKELRKAVELDSTFGLAWYRLAYAISWLQTAGGAAGPVLEKAMTLIERLPEKERFLLRALQAEDNGNFKKGVEILREMEKNYPDDKEMMYNIGDWSYHGGDLVTSTTYLEKVLVTDPTFERALQHLTWATRDQEQFSKMTEMAKRYVAASGSTEAYNLLRDGYVALGQYDQALKALQSARELFPKQFELTGSIATLYLSQGQLPQAEAELKGLITADQPPAAKKVGYVGLSGYYSYLGKIQDALRTDDRRIAIAIEEKDTVGMINRYFQRAFILVTAGEDRERAVKEMEKALALDPWKRPEVRVNLAAWYAFEGNITAADTLSRPVVFVRPMLLSMAYGANHDCAKAEAYLDSAFQSSLIHIAKMICLNATAKCEVEGAQFDKALTTVNRMLAFKEIAGTNFQASAHYLLGRTYEGKGDKKLAIENYEKFLGIWKNADKELLRYKDASARLGKLKAIAAM